ncbi:tRNA lysidine(34) synthetase TilS [Prevotella sp. KH2C16]|uniref:tRNA lysidine(34) synthetase TilS n=1 Tax=Prevotella sp. KH2C16 TaxID=1855325 RepID=UPI0008DFA460|nr:tRNA lysidine(34) synthetase TilS [Prevotella sp. KH2C16]SFF98170.1 tRNA(Ile)-lysidine synthase [Prevotella sp. KH2C16]
MLNRIIDKYIRQNDLLRKDGRYLVALSGGADSVSLLLILKSLGYQIEAVHCNFHLRGEESDRDERFCIDLCAKESIPLHLVHFDTKTYAEVHKVSIEMAARELRYKYFEQLRADIKADDICVAHHREDSVETILLNLVRGTGIQGLTGIDPRNGHIVRPLLCVSRLDLEDYLNQRGQKFVTDSSNLIDDVQRNKIRLKVIPLLKEINPKAVENIHKSSLYLREVEKVALSTVRNDLLEGKKLSFDRLKTMPSPEFSLWYILKDYRFSASQIKEMLEAVDSQSGKEWHSDSHIVVTDRDGFIIDELKKQDSLSMKIIEEGCYILPNRGLKLEIHSVEKAAGFEVDKRKNVAMLDAGLVKFPLIVRDTIAGDRFMPFGMQGTKLVSDFLTDLKKDILSKREQLVVTDVSGNILWVVNERPDNRFRITAKTRTILVLELA